MTVTVICPNLRCRSILQVPEATRGRSVRCGKCGSVFLVPEKKGGLSTQAAEPAPKAKAAATKKGKGK